MKRICMLLVLALTGCAGQSNVDSARQVSRDKEGASVLERAQLHTQLAAGYLELGNFAVALEETREALRADPDYAPAYNLMGLINLQFKDDAAAEASFQRALRLDPADSDTLNNYGWFLCQRKQEEEGIRHFLTALRNPLYANPDKSWVNAGSCALRRGDANGAQEYYQQALRVRPGQPQALLGLADLAYKRGDLPEAKTFHARLIRDNPPTAEALWLGVRIERKLGDRNAEASYGAQLRRNFPDSAEARALQAGRYE